MSHSSNMGGEERGDFISSLRLSLASLIKHPPTQVSVCPSIHPSTHLHHFSRFHCAKSQAQINSCIFCTKSKNVTVKKTRRLSFYFPNPNWLDVIRHLSLSLENLDPNTGLLVELLGQRARKGQEELVKFHLTCRLQQTDLDYDRSLVAGVHTYIPSALSPTFQNNLIRSVAD